MKKKKQEFFRELRALLSEADVYHQLFGPIWRERLPDKTEGWSVRPVEVRVRIEKVEEK